MKILVTGSRTYNKPLIILNALMQFVDAELIHGGAKGADEIAGRAARKLGFKEIEVKADWDMHGKAAGPIRNRQMLDMQPDVVLAFKDGDSPGTSDCIKEARNRGLMVYVYNNEGLVPDSYNGQ